MLVTLIKKLLTCFVVLLLLNCYILRQEFVFTDALIWSTIVKTLKLQRPRHWRFVLDLLDGCRKSVEHQTIDCNV